MNLTFPQKMSNFNYSNISTSLTIFDCKKEPELVLTAKLMEDDICIIRIKTLKADEK